MPTNYLDCETCGHLLDLHISKGGKMMCEQCDCDKKIVYVSQKMQIIAVIIIAGIIIGILMLLGFIIWILKKAIGKMF